MTPPRWLHWPAAGGWSPSDLADLQCWLDASDSATITLSGSSVTLWEDKAGSNDADDAVDSTNTKVTTKRPTIVTAAQNSLDAIEFNGSQNFDHNSARAMLRNRASALFVGVGKFGGNLTQFRFFWSNAGGTAGPFRAYLGTASGGAGNFRFVTRRLDTDSFGPDIASAADTDWHVFIGYSDWATNGVAQFFIDGTLVGSSTGFASAVGNTSNTDLSTAYTAATAIGSYQRFGNGSLSSGSRIGELLCYAKSSGTFSSADREKIEGYLAHKWGLTGSLPSTHPYKATAP